MGDGTTALFPQAAAGRPGPKTGGMDARERYFVSDRIRLLLISTDLTQTPTLLNQVSISHAPVCAHKEGSTNPWCGRAGNT